jgi:4-amino-4-deoxy-L-arabinose transferase-like glycosyltransferase
MQIAVTARNEAAITTVRRDYLVLISLWSILALVAVPLMWSDTEPPWWDEAVHLKDSIVYYNILTHLDEINPKVIREIVNLSNDYPRFRPSGYYPPLVPGVTALSYLIFGVSSKVAIVGNLFYVGILLLFTYLIGCYVFNPSTGLLASFLLVSSPVVFQQSLIYMLDLPLTAMVALTLYLLLKSDNFENRSISILFGISAGLGMLAKWTFPGFIIGPVLWACYQRVKGILRAPESRQEDKRALGTLLLSLLAFLVVAGTYYFPLLKPLLGKTLYHSKGEITDIQVGPVWSLDSLSYYVSALGTDLMNSVVAGFACFGVLVLLKKRCRAWAWMLITLVIPYLIFTLLIQNKQERYMMPWMIPVALIASFWLFEVSLRSFLRWSLVAALILFSAISFSRVVIAERDRFMEDSNSYWKITEILDGLERDVDTWRSEDTKNTRPVYIGVIANHMVINGFTLAYYAAARGKNWTVEFFPKMSLEEYQKKIEDYDYVLLRNPLTYTSKWGGPVPRKEKIEAMAKYFVENVRSFKILRWLTLEDGSEVSIFRKNRLGAAVAHPLSIVPHVN